MSLIRARSARTLAQAAPSAEMGWHYRRYAADWLRLAIIAQDLIPPARVARVAHVGEPTTDEWVSAGGPVTVESIITNARGENV